MLITKVPLTATRRGQKKLRTAKVEARDPLMRLVDRGTRILFADRSTQSLLLPFLASLVGRAFLCVCVRVPCVMDVEARRLAARKRFWNGSGSRLLALERSVSAV